MHPSSLRRPAVVLSSLALALSAALSLSACGGKKNYGSGDYPTLDGKAPLIVGHRGAAGYRPDHTLEGYKLAIEQGADFIEPDLVMTKDGVLVARHEPHIGGTTDVSKRPEFANRKRTMLVDGETVADNWFVHDFTLAELKTLRAVQPMAERDHQYDGQFLIPTFEEVLDLAKTEGAKRGKTIGVYPETKHPTYHVSEVKVDGKPLPNMNDELLRVLAKYGYTQKASPVIVQSFETANLKYLRSKTQVRLIQLVDGDDLDLVTGKVTYSASRTGPWDRPYDWTFDPSKKGLTADALLTDKGLAEVAKYADGIAPWKYYIVNMKGTLDAKGKPMDVNGDGKVNYADGTTPVNTDFIDRAHDAGLMVHTWTFRNDVMKDGKPVGGVYKQLAHAYKGDPKNEYLQFFRLGLDGLFSDFPDTAVAAREAFKKELGL